MQQLFLALNNRQCNTINFEVIIATTLASAWKESIALVHRVVESKLSTSIVELQIQIWKFKSAKVARIFRILGI